MEEDPLKDYVNSLGLNWQLVEALQSGDLQTLILGLLSEENSDPLLASMMQLMLAQNQAMSHGTAEQGKADGQRTAGHNQSDVGVTSSANGQSSAVRAILRHV